MSASSHAERRTSFPSSSTGYVLHLFKANRAAPWVYIYRRENDVIGLPEHRWFTLDADAVRQNETLQRDAVGILAFVVDNAK
jgi:hypothetical protein